MRRCCSSSSGLDSWVFMLSAYARNGQLRDAEDVFSAIPSKNPESRNAMLAACAQNGNLSGAKRIFDSFEEKTIVSWNAMVSAYAQNGHLALAQLAFDSMPQRNLVSLRIVMEILELARWIFNQMPVWNMVSFTTMLVVIAQTGDLIESEGLFESMLERNLVSHNAVLLVHVLRNELKAKYLQNIFKPAI